MVLSALFALLLCQLGGEALSHILHSPVPGPVFGMLLLATFYIVRRREPDEPMQKASDGLLRWLGLLFVPAGVGVVVHLDLLRASWLPVTVALLGSTLLMLLTTALLMRWFTRGRA